MPYKRSTVRTQATRTRRVTFARQGWADYEYWLGADRRKLRRLNKLIDDARRHPFEGLGKPEELQQERGLWSRRITQEHRLVYRVHDAGITVLQARYHYGRD